MRRGSGRRATKSITRSSALRGEGADAAPVGRVLDQLCEAPLAGRLALGADHPVRGRPPVPGRLGVEELRRRGARAQLLLVLRRELRGLALLVGVDRRAVVAAALERGEARGPHEALVDELPHALDVDRAPVRARLARREADRVRLVAQAAAHAVDPAEAQRLVDRLRPGDAPPRAALLVEADEQL